MTYEEVLVARWFFQQLLKEEIKIIQKCVLLNENLTEKFVIISDDGKLGWKCLKNISNPWILISKNSWNQYLKKIENELNMFIPYVYENAYEDYNKLSYRLVEVIQQRYIYDTASLCIKEKKIRERMYFYEVLDTFLKKYGRVSYCKASGEILWFSFI